MTDKEFDLGMERIKQRDREGLRCIYEEYGGYIYKTILALVKNPQDAEDLTSDFFLRLWQKAEQYRSGQGHKAYLARIAHNMAVDHLKAARAAVSLDDEESLIEPAASERVDETVERGMHFDEAMSLLSGTEGEIVNMHLGLELTFKEIAGMLGLPLGTVAWKYRTAIEKLKKAVKGGAVV